MKKILNSEYNKIKYTSFFLSTLFIILYRICVTNAKLRYILKYYFSSDVKFTRVYRPRR